MISNLQLYSFIIVFVPDTVLPQVNMISSTFLIAALAASVNAHGVILNAQGVSGSPASVGFQGI